MDETIFGATTEPLSKDFSKLMSAELIMISNPVAGFEHCNNIFDDFHFYILWCQYFLIGI